MALRIYMLCVMAVTAKTQNTSDGGDVPETTPDAGNGLSTTTVTTQIPSLSAVSDNGTVSSPTGSLASNRPENNSSRLDKKVKSETTTLSSTITTNVSSADEARSENGSPPPTDCPELPEVEGRKTVVLCKCKANEILSDSGHCLPYEGDMYIEEERTSQPISTYKVISQDIHCNEHTHRLVHYRKGQFYFRPFRGDIILNISAEELDGQNIHEFCIDYQKDSAGNLTWTLKGCVPHPAIPRCCPFGQAMADGSCQPKRTPLHLTPQISAKLYGDSVNWTKLTHFTAPLKCFDDSIKTYRLSSSTDHLISFANGLHYFWQNPELVISEVYRSCGEFCVDGITNSNGIVNYFVSFCYLSPEKHHQQVCGDGPCIRKCCRDEEAVMPEGKMPQCKPFWNDTFDITEITNLTEFNVVQGFPLCNHKMFLERVDEIHIKEKGYLSYSIDDRGPKHYCIDSLMSKGSHNVGGYICQFIVSVSDKVRQKLFPITTCISFIFLVISILCYIMIPKMIQHGGLHQLCHAIFLAIAYLANFVEMVYLQLLPLSSPVCLLWAIIKQFGYLGAFFWLNAMCFELWRTTRSLKNFMRGYKRVPTWCFMVYAIGFPFCICLATVLMHFLAEDYVPGVIKPGIGVHGCWFADDFALISYFYGHVGVLFAINIVFFVLTLIDHRQLMQKYEANVKYLKKEGDGGKKYLKKEGDGGKKPAHGARGGQPTLKCIVDHVPEFTQKLRIFIICAALWVTEIFAFKILPKWIWLPTDIFNTLQGFILFLIFLGNRNKRKLLRRKFPRIFKMADLLAAVLCHAKKSVCCWKKKEVTSSSGSSSTRRPSVSELGSSFMSMSTISVDDITLSTTVESLENKDGIAPSPQALDSKREGEGGAM